jgi:2,3,4,5-tetrahydropyridine-2-carboxylate N-succinyltransferase
MSQDLEAAVDAAWEGRDDISPATTGDVRDAIGAALELLDTGKARVAEKKDGDWHVNQWLKKAVLLSFRLNDMATINGGPGTAPWFDMVPWGEERFREAGFRAVPNCIVRHSAYIAPGVVLMPSFVNLGAYVDSGTMVDTWATVGSCAQIGKDCHISGGAGIGGVLEPLQAGPVIIEDNCYIGASTKIVDRASGEVHTGRVPAYSVVAPGAMPGKEMADGSPGPSLYCAVIVKRVDEQTRSKTSINDLLRD